LVEEGMDKNARFSAKGDHMNQTFAGAGVDLGGSIGPCTVYQVSSGARGDVMGEETM
jgi:hypothetical protein